jgi:hypothetical protein
MIQHYGITVDKASRQKDFMKIKFLSIIALTFFHFATFGQKSDPVDFSNISIDTMGLVKWTTKYTHSGSSLHILVERLVNSKWTEVGGYGSTWLFDPPTSSITRNDSSRVKFHKGVNKYRIRMTQPSQATSSEFELISKVSNDDGSLWATGGQIILDKKEYWEIISNKDGLLKKGDSKIVDISFLPSGPYWLYTSSATKTFTKN